MRFLRSRSYSASSVGSSKRHTGHSLLFFSQSWSARSEVVQAGKAKEAPNGIRLGFWQRL